MSKSICADHDPAAQTMELTQIYEWTPPHGGVLSRVTKIDLLHLLSAEHLGELAVRGGLHGGRPQGGPSAHPLPRRKSPDHSLGPIGIVPPWLPTTRSACFSSRTSRRYRSMCAISFSIRSRSACSTPSPTGAWSWTTIRELRPDALMVDALLQGKVNGLEVAEQVRQAGIRIPIIIVTVPQKPVKAGEGHGHHRSAVDAVLGLRADERAQSRECGLSRHGAKRDVSLVRGLLRQGRRGPHHHRLQPGGHVRTDARRSRRAHRRRSAVQ